MVMGNNTPIVHYSLFIYKKRLAPLFSCNLLKQKFERLIYS